MPMLYNMNLYWIARWLKRRKTAYIPPVGRIRLSRLGCLLLSVIILIVYVQKDEIVIQMLQLRLNYQIQKVARMTFIVEEPDLLEDSSSRNKTLCPKKPPNLVPDPRPVDFTNIDLGSLTRNYIPYRHGGHFKPEGCVSRTKTAVIVPFRDRERHLPVLLNHIIPFLVRQQTEFAIFVVEQTSKGTFNKAIMMNVGFLEALKTNDFHCFVFNDVDMVPESDFNLYRCGRTPRHLPVAINIYGYKLMFYENAGGAIAMSRDIFKDVNGYSNLYFGWGGEDDDMAIRLAWKNYPISRYPPAIGRYTSASHKHDVGNAVSNTRYNILWTGRNRMQTDGLTSLKYKILKVETLQLYTRILVDINFEDYRNEVMKATQG